MDLSHINIVPKMDMEWLRVKPTHVRDGSQCDLVPEPNWSMTIKNKDTKCSHSWNDSPSKDTGSNQFVGLR